MDLYIIRHAWADYDETTVWPDDRLRPLNKEGKQRFARMVKKLAKVGFAPEMIATSPLVRCRQTADLAAEGVDGSPPVVECDALVPGSDLAGMIAWTTQHAHDCQSVAWVGHAPDVSHMAGQLTGAGGDAINFAKGAVACIRFAELPELGTGVLRWLATAKVLGVRE